MHLWDWCPSLLAAGLVSIWPFAKREKPEPPSEEDVSGQEEPPEAWAVAINLALLGRFADAASKFASMAEQDPDNPALHYNLGLAQLEMEQFEHAAESFKKAIELAPDRADAYSNLGAALHHLGRTDEACEAFKQAVQLRPEEPDHYFNWGTALLLQDSYPEAAEMLGHAYDRNPGDPQYCLNFALCLAALERHDDAARALEAFLKLARGRYAEQEAWASEYLESQQVRS